MANANPEVKGSINNIKEHRINVLLNSKPICERYFYYNSETKNFAIEDPALFYYLKYLDWEEILCNYMEENGVDHLEDMGLSCDLNNGPDNTKSMSLVRRFILEARGQNSEKCSCAEI